MKFYFCLILFLLLTSIPIECMKVIKSHKAVVKKKKHKLKQQKVQKKKLQKHKKHRINVKGHKIQRRKLGGMETFNALLPLLIVVIYIFALIKMENPVILFFLAPFLMDILNKIKGVAGGGSKAKPGIPGIPKIPGMPAMPGFPFPAHRRVLIDFSQIAQIGSIIQQMNATQTKEPTPQDLGSSLQTFQNPQFQQIFQQLNQFMQSKKIDKTADPQNQIVSLAEEFLTTKYGMKQKGLKKELNNITAQLLSNQGNIMKLLQNNI